MTLISLLLVLAIERATNKTPYWQSDYYTSGYSGWLEKRNILSSTTSLQTLLAITILPAVLLWLVLHQMDVLFVTFIIDTSVLMVCIGCPDLRQSYRGYLEAASRGDTEATVLYAEELGYPCNSQNSFGQCLVWVNYRHYAAVAIWFVVLGSAGALLYVLSSYVSRYLQRQQHEQLQSWQTVMEIIDWVPARIHTLGLLVVGHFSKALNLWLNYLGRTDIEAQKVVTDIAQAAEYVEPDGLECTEEPCTMVRLAKRNMMALLVVVAALTLTGVMH